VTRGHNRQVTELNTASVLPIDKGPTFRRSRKGANKLKHVPHGCAPGHKGAGALYDLRKTICYGLDGLIDGELLLPVVFTTATAAPVATPATITPAITA
jgi:hypothetical protein